MKFTAVVLSFCSLVNVSAFSPSSTFDNLLTTQKVALNKHTLRNWSPTSWNPATQTAPTFTATPGFSGFGQPVGEMGGNNSPYQSGNTSYRTPLPASVRPGVLSGQAMFDLLNHAKDNCYAIPAVNCVSASGINACLEAASKNRAPIIIQFSSGGAQFYAGKGLDNSDYGASIDGAIAGAYHVRTLAKRYGVPVILHTDHCAKSLLPWVDGLIDASEQYFRDHGEPLFSSHMIDLSEEPLQENLEICAAYLARMSRIGLLLEMELGITGGEEDGQDNTDVPQEDLYSKPEEIFLTYQKLSAVSPLFTVAAAFGNVHGVYKPGNVKLEPEILNRAQQFISMQLGIPATEKPVKFVFHGGSGSDVRDIQTSIDYGVIKMNIDTDTQWSYWEGVKNFEKEYHHYLQGQIGNPEGPEKPNKKIYDPRVWMREAEINTVNRLGKAFEDLKCQNIF